MIDDLGIDEWYLESNQRGHWLAFNASLFDAEELVEVLDATSLGVKAWGESFRPAADGVRYDWYILLKSKCMRDECLRLLGGLLDRRREEPTNEIVQDPPRAGKSLWQRVVSVLPWVHDKQGDSSAPSEARPTRSVFNDLAGNRITRTVHELHVTFDTGSWPSNGVLRELGYKVGQNGLGPVERRRILRTAYAVTLTGVSKETRSYIAEWGEPNSQQRADKIERCLSNFAEVARRRSADMSEAIADWEDDLDWFRREGAR
ncbi:hypothetical protein [Mycolicibacterium diernhoferi]|uniref:Uncharacterized protein n=1 Tax=Mycolicibacterium diernhoferi TaxID=1801 RepID=A0A1Q4H7S6_9MYCO|nr:hypothetical protein [Mycolicibacterium diernhoferi]OJZ63492.1 hypothetical protein BRW64_21915 [Mycolicibacterium diernhoferi]OPE56278.1 hypothetical protein BV510_00635 [Mycolicibacterium diernhoferi]PEG55508.1 hypothetical protein CRI78_06255 [Mycolicibacterium diernhoferi]QYL24424.1 hypothetical protein K0O62_09290 [Mycolicibacterium diernhoferi]